MKTNLLRLFMMLFALSLFVTSCENVKLTDPEADKESIDDNAIGERAVGDVFGFVNDGQSGKKEGSCPAESWEGNAITGYTLTLDFGEAGSGCTCADGIVRSGKIKAQFGGVQIWVAKANVTVSFENYVVDGNQLTGSITASMTGIGAFQIDATGMQMTFSDGGTMKWNSSKTIEKSATSWIMNGEATGTLRNGKTFVRVTENLTKSPDCEWFTAGKVTLTIGTGDEASAYIMEYKTCGKVEITYNGISYTQDL